MKIAIVGISAIFPKAMTAGKFWNNIKNKVDGVTKFPFDKRWGRSDLYMHGARPSLFSTYCQHAGIITDELPFDPVAFGIIPTEIPEIDVDHLLTLNLVKDALADAGISISPRNSKRLSAGLIVGRVLPIGPATLRLLELIKSMPQIIDILKNSIPGITEGQVHDFRESFINLKGDFNSGKGFNSVGNLLASRVANRLNLSGNSYTLDAACASSLVAIQNAVTELENKNCDLMVAGGVNFPVSHVIWQVFSNMGALAASNSIRPFSEKADGTILGEGGGFVVLKRYDDAVRDHDRIYAVIEGIGTSSDGRSKSMMSPDSPGQADACNIAWRNAAVDIRDISLIECHGTGMPVGDLTEIQTLRTVFEPHLKNKTPIGSVKSMIGHTLAASGIASVIKTASAIYEGVLPPGLHNGDPCRSIKDSIFYLNEEPKIWETKKLAAINAFGFGGINSHLILSGGPAKKKIYTALIEKETGHHENIICMARASAASLLSALETGDHHKGSGHFRLVIKGPTPEKIAIAKDIIAREEICFGRNDIFYSYRNLSADQRRTVFLFPGIGVFINPELEKIIHDLDPALSASLSEMAQDKETMLGSSAIITGYAMFRLLENAGISPGILAGHSLGDWTSCLAAGIINISELPAILEKIMTINVGLSNKDFGLYSVICHADKLRHILRDAADIHIVNDNSPSNTIICLNKKNTPALKELLVTNNILFYDLGLNVVTHHPSIESSYSAIRPVIDKLDIGKPKFPVWNSTLAAPLPLSASDTRHVIYNNMLLPVRFREMISELYASGARIFIQLGVGGLSGFVKDILHDKPDVLTLDTTSRIRSTKEMIDNITWSLFAEGKNMGINIETGPEQKIIGQAVSLHSSLTELVSSGISFSYPGKYIKPGKKIPEHTAYSDLLKRSADSYYNAHLEILNKVEELKQLAVVSPNSENISSPQIQLNWEELIDINYDLYPELYDHEIFRHHKDIAVCYRSAVVPIAMMITISCRIIRKKFPHSFIKEIIDSMALKFLSVTEAIQVKVKIVCVDTDLYKVAWENNFSCTIKISHSASPMVMVDNEHWKINKESPLPFVCTAKELYDKFYLFHGPAYQGLVRELEQDISGSLTQVRFPGGCGSLLDSAMQSGAIWLYSSITTRNLVLPLRIGRIELFCDEAVFEDPSADFLARTFVVKNTSFEYSYNMDVATGNRLLMRLTAFQGRKFESNEKIETVYCHSPGPHFISEQTDSCLYMINAGFINSKWTWNMIESTYLDNKDKERLQTLRSIKTQQSFILGRIVARECIKKFIMENHAVPELFPTEIEILYDASGAPYGIYKGLPRKKMNLSIAHKGNFAVALFGYDKRVGIDLEQIVDPDFERSLYLFLSKNELEYLEQFAREEKLVMQTLIWTAKEAYYKYQEVKAQDFTQIETSDIVKDTTDLTSAQWTGLIDQKVFYSRLILEKYILTWIK